MEAQRIGGGRHLAADVVDRARQLAHRSPGVGIVHIVEQRRGDPQGGLRQRFGEHAVHLRRYLIRTLPGHLGRDGVLLFV